MYVQSLQTMCMQWFPLPVNFLCPKNWGEYYFHLFYMCREFFYDYALCFLFCAKINTIPLHCQWFWETWPAFFPAALQISKFCLHPHCAKNTYNTPTVARHFSENNRYKTISQMQWKDTHHFSFTFHSTPNRLQMETHLTHLESQHIVPASCTHPEDFTVHSPGTTNYTGATVHP